MSLELEDPVPDPGGGEVELEAEVEVILEFDLRSRWAYPRSRDVAGMKGTGIGLIAPLNEYLEKGKDDFWHHRCVF